MMATGGLFIELLSDKKCLCPAAGRDWKMVDGGHAASSHVNSYQHNKWK